MGRNSRRSSEDNSRRRYRRGSSSPRRTPSAERSKPVQHSKPTEKRYSDRKTDRSRTQRSRSGSARRSRSRSASPAHVQTRRMSMQAQQNQQEIQLPIGANMQTDILKVEGDFSNFPEITQKTRESLIARGITYLFPVQVGSFRHVTARKDLIVRDLTGSGKTLAYALPTIEYLRKSKTLGTGKI